jgi:hypothetical protein
MGGKVVGPRALALLEGRGKLRKSNDFIGTRTRNLPACSIVPKPRTLPRAPNDYVLPSDNKYVAIQFIAVLLLL